MKITLYGQVVSQKNSKTITYNKKTGKPFIMSNQNVQKWKKVVAQQLKEQQKIPGEVSITAIFFNRDKRKRDLDNMTTSVLDALKNSQIIEDDNCFVVKELHSYFGGVDTLNPRAEITIDKIAKIE